MIMPTAVCTWQLPGAICSAGAAYLIDIFWDIGEEWTGQ